jgi:hypothetical protein
MALENSGTMSIGGSTAGRSINLELDKSATATSGLGDADLRTLAGVASGAISMSDFYGASNNADPGTITAVYNNSGDNYSGGNMSTKNCNGISYSSFDARPPNSTQASSITSSWTNCKLYSGDGVSPTVSAGVFWGRTNYSVTLTYSGWKGGAPMADYVYLNGSRVINFDGTGHDTGNLSSPQGGYVYWTMPASGSTVITVNFTSGGDPPYIYWSGYRYQYGADS